MLPASQRLPRALFSPAGMKGKRLRGTSLQVSYIRAPDFRAAVVVSKKVAKSAVERNRIRRKIYALLAHYTRAAHTGHIIVVARPAISTSTPAAVKAELHTLLTGLLPQSPHTR